MKTIKVSEIQIVSERKANYWRGFKVGLAIGLIALMVEVYLLNKLISVCL